MKKELIAAMAATAMLTSAFGAINAGASYSEELTVYVNGTKIDNEQYKPIIVNDRTLVRLVPIFDALGYEHSEMDENKSVSFVQKGSNAAYRFTAESSEAIIGSDGGDSYYLDVPATLQYFDVFYVPIRAFCEMTGLDIQWDDASRSVYVTGNKALNVQPEKEELTYEEAREIAIEYVNDDDILLSVDKDLVSHNGRQAYSFTLRSKSMGGSGTMGVTVYVYTDNGEVDSVNEAPGKNN